ncbi:MAG: MBG domain-containing protein, partial [Bacteroidota bacterium]
TSACPTVPAAVARAQNITVSLNENGIATITSQDVDNGSTDECGDPIGSLALDISSFDCTNLGANTVTLTATTTGGEIATETATVTVEPYLGPQTINAYLDANGTVTIVALDVIGTSACTSELVYGFGEFIDASLTYDCTNVGSSITNSMDAQTLNGSGITYSQPITIQVLDTISPAFVNLPTTYTASLGTNSSVFVNIDDDIGFGSQDNCIGVRSVRASLSQAIFTCADVGDNVVVATIEDASGNRSTQNITITVTGGATQQTVSTNAPTSSVCPDGTAYTVTVDGSQTGIDYILTDTSNGSVIDGPITGTGSSIDFNTGAVNETTTFEVFAQTPSVVLGASFILEGDDDHADAVRVWDFDYSLAYTLEFTFNGTTNPVNFQNSLFSVGTSSTSDIEVYFQQNENVLVVSHNRGKASEVRFNRYVSPAANADVDIAIVYDNITGVKVYYNGVEQAIAFSSDPIIGTELTKVATGGNAWRIGAIDNNVFGNTETGTGTFEEVRVWSRALGDAEILANSGVCVDPNASGLVHYYKLDENSGLTISDETGSLDMTITNPNSSNNWTTELISCGSICQTRMANTITIGDLTAPQLTTVTSFDLDLDASGNATLDLAAIVNTATDNCSDSSALVFTADIMQFDCSNIGTTSIMLTVRDEGGNETMNSVDINVRDVTAPVINANNFDPFGIGFNPTLPPLEFRLNANNEVVIFDLVDLRSSAIDNCRASSTVTLSPTTFTCADLGSQTITITATDAAGNQQTGTETIVIRDGTNPVASTQNVTISIDANGNATLDPASVNDNSSDNCTDDASLILSVSQTSFDCNNLGVNNVTLTVEDASGNTDTDVVSVTVVDNIAPVAVAQDITVDRGVVFQPSQVDNGSSDNCSVTLSLDQNIFNTLGTNTVTLTATDPAGNTATATATVTVVEPRDPQTISFNAISDGVYGESVTLSATASSSLPVTFTVSNGPGTIDGNTLTFTGIGQVTVIANQDGDATFSPAAPVSRAANASKASLMVTADNRTITFGDATPMFTVSYSGFVGSDDVNDLDAVPNVTVSNTSIITSDRQVFTLTPSGGSDDLYDLDYVNGLYTILKAAQLITFPGISDVDLASNNTVMLGGSSDAGLPISYSITSGSSIATISGNTLTLSGTGSVTIRSSQPGNTDYLAATPVDVSFDVTDSRKQDQTITFGTLSDVAYGVAPITLAATASSGLAVTYQVSGSAQLSGNELQVTGIGTVEVIASQVGDASFNAATNVTQSFSVSAARITITPNDQQIIVGEALPTFTFTYSGFVNGEDASVFDATPTVGSPTADANTVGTYPIIVTQDAVAGNYVFTNGEGTLTVSEVPLGLFDADIKIYPNPVSETLNIDGILYDQASIITLDGRMILETSDNVIEVGSLSSGIFILKLTKQGKEIHSQRIKIK